MLVRFLSAIFAILLTSMSGPLLAGPQYASAGTDTTAAVTVALDTQEIADLTYMREEEKVARDTYLVYFDQWANTIFSNIASTEQTHMDAILGLLEKCGLPDPAAGNRIGNLPTRICRCSIPISSPWACNRNSRRCASAA